MKRYENQVGRKEGRAVPGSTMTAKDFHVVYAAMRPPTPRKILKALRKHGVRDTYDNLDRFAGIGWLSMPQAQEFIDRAKEQQEIEKTSRKRRELFSYDHRVRP